MATAEYGHLYDPNTIGAQPEDPLWMSLLDSAPGAGVAVGWNMGRVSNTIIDGGTSSHRRARMRNPREFSYASGRGEGGFIRGGLTQTFGPRHARRFTRAANIDPSFYGKSSKIYSPFNFLSSAGNMLFKRQGMINSVSPTLAARMGKYAGEGPAFSPGTLGRIRSFSRMSTMSSEKFALKSANIRAAIADINPDYYNNVFTKAVRGYGAYDDMGVRMAYRSGVGSTIGGRISGRAAGWVQGTEAAYQAARSGNYRAIHGAMSTATGHFREGVEAGAKAFSEGGKFAKFAGRGGVSSALRGVNAASWVLLAHDLAEMGGKLIGAGIKTAFEAAQSVKGSIDKPIMGMGFRDNTVAATSRQRGVMAISNSRLNARSALGSEASYMNARFG